MKLEETTLEEAGAALSEAARQVLETMCFVDAGDVPDGAALSAPAAATIAAQVEFRGIGPDAAS